MTNCDHVKTQYEDLALAYLIDAMQYLIKGDLLAAEEKLGAAKKYQREFLKI